MAVAIAPISLGLFGMAVKTGNVGAAAEAVGLDVWNVHWHVWVVVHQSVEACRWWTGDDTVACFGWGFWDAIPAA